jgi:uncharacterized membrane protein
MRILLILLLSLPLAYAAQIYGTLYSWETFEPLNDVVVEINTTPEQVLVSRDGSYSFSVPDGSYLLRARYYENNLLKLEAEEVIEVPQNGSYRIDLILFPTFEEEFLFDDIDVSILEEGKQSNSYLFIIIAIFLISAIFAGYLYLKNREKEEESEPLPEDLVQVLEIIKSEGGRVKQSELRKRLGCSEAKLSLMLTDLEHRGKIKKIKKGRGNIVILK